MAATEPAGAAARHRVVAGQRFRLADHATDDTGDYGPDGEDRAAARLEELRDRISDLHDRFAAQASHALLVVLQGFDGAGKDSVITHVVSAIDPAELHVFSFNKPVGEEAEHDFLWRFHQQTPARGKVHVFDRSHYEEVIAARVHDDIDDGECAIRYESIHDFERILCRENTIILKFFLRISKDTQADRVRERLEDPAKKHEFGAADVLERENWDAFEEAYEDAVNATSTEDAPWYVVPGDHRWYSRVTVAEIIAATLEQLDPQFPALDREELEEAGLDPDDPKF
jgi:PPK2 family polyphosphate:nucleotide phosphotransferase